MPDGIRPFSELTIGMEFVCGGLYRVLAGAGLVKAPFHVFLVSFISWFSSLSILAVWLLGRTVWRSERAGLAAAALYAVSPLSFHRLPGNFGREDFTLPLLFFFTAFFIRSLRAEGKRRAILEANAAGCFAAAALATWHLSRFFILCFAPVLPIVVLFGGDRGRLRRSVWVVTAWQTAASLAIPVLASKQNILSAGTLSFLAASALLPLAARAGWSRRRTAALLAGLVLLSVPAANLAAGDAEYAHVSSLMRHKLLRLGEKPEDPARIPFDARVFWSPPFNSPGVPFFLATTALLSPWFAAGLAASVRRVLRRRSDEAEAAVLYLALAYLLFFLLVERLSVFLVFFSALLAGGLLAGPSRWKRGLPALLLLFLACQAMENGRGAGSWSARAARAASPAGEGTEVLNLGNNRRLVEWIRAATEPDDVFLTWYPTGSTVLLYGDRPIVLHSMFESSGIRDRYRRFLEALYGPEEGMARFCESLGVDYFVYQANLTLDLTDDSEVYRTGLRALPTSSAAFLFHFYPDALRSFTLVYQDSYYRVFRYAPGAVAVPSHPLPREEVWETFRPQRDAPSLDPAVVRAILERLRARGALFERASAAFAKADFGTANLFIDDILALSPDAEEAILLRARIAWSKDEPEHALSLIDRGLELRPESAEFWFLKGQILLDRNRPARGAKALATALRSNPDHPEARELLAKLDAAIRTDAETDRTAED
jgi:tetratricopeptide (TPR) repeat protein